MNTTISSKGLSQLQPTKNEQSASAEPEPSTASAIASQPVDDSVQLTDSARALQQASAAGQSSQVDAARVAQIRQSLTDGSYRVDAGAIADRLTALENQISGS